MPDLTTIMTNPNAFATLVIPALLVILLVYFVLDALNRGWYRCPVCDFETRSEAEAAGHQALHSQHKPVRVD